MIAQWKIRLSSLNEIRFLTNELKVAVIAQKVVAEKDITPKNKNSPN